MRQLISVAMIFGILALTVYTLVASKSVFIPIVIAIVIWFLIISVAGAFRAIRINGYSLPYPLSLLCAFALSAGLGWIVVSIVSGNITALAEAAPSYQAKIHRLMEKIASYTGHEVPYRLADILPRVDAATVLGLIISAFTFVVSNAGLVVIYVLFLLLEYRTFDKKLAALLPREEHLEEARLLVKKIAHQAQSYILIKTGLSLLTALCCYLVLYTVGVDFADFWAFLIFLLNYIPNIGSIVATIFPCLLTLLQFESISTLIVVTLALTSIHFFIGNYLEPKLMSRSFNLSGLVIVLFLTFWGQIWGLVGMFLCVPILVILNIILSNFPQTKKIAILFSEDGKIN